jgi:hypothetical protein
MTNSINLWTNESKISINSYICYHMVKKLIPLLKIFIYKYVPKAITKYPNYSNDCLVKLKFIIN